MVGRDAEPDLVAKIRAGPIGDDGIQLTVVVTHPDTIKRPRHLVCVRRKGGIQTLNAGCPVSTGCRTPCGFEGVKATGIAQVNPQQLVDPLQLLTLFVQQRRFTTQRQHMTQAANRQHQHGHQHQQETPAQAAGP